MFGAPDLALLITVVVVLTSLLTTYYSIVLANTSDPSVRSRYGIAVRSAIRPVFFSAEKAARRHAGRRRFKLIARMLE